MLLYSRYPEMKSKYRSEHFVYSLYFIFQKHITTQISCIK